jgi:hypothetical protein
LPIGARSPWKACPVSARVAIAPSTRGSAHCLTAKRGTPFSPRAHYKLGTWFWRRRYSWWPRPHEFGIHDFYTWPTNATPSSLATGVLGRGRAYSRRQLLANAAIAASRVGS